MLDGRLQEWTGRFLEGGDLLWVLKDLQEEGQEQRHRWAGRARSKKAAWGRSAAEGGGRREEGRRRRQPERRSMR